MRIRFLIPCLAAWFLAACGSVQHLPSERPWEERAEASEKGQEVVFLALSLIDTGYRFGGKNPEAGLDCGGMVTYIYDKALGLKVKGSAADIARLGRPVDRSRLRAGDLVFFNTRNAPFSHVGVYIGNGRFVHAPSSNGRVRIDRLGSSYFARHFEEARAYFD